MGNTVKIRVSELDRGKSDSKNILRIILEVDEDKDLYKISIKEERLVQTNQFNIYRENFISK